MPDEAEALGLLALLLLTESRRAARVAADGSLVLLADQDRSLWDHTLIAEGQDLVRACLRRNTPGPYQIQAAINAVHSDAPTAADTDWGQIVALYDQLARASPRRRSSPSTAPSPSPRSRGRPPASPPWTPRRTTSTRYHLFHATRADLLRRLGRRAEAADAYTTAIDVATNDAETPLSRGAAGHDGGRRHVSKEQRGAHAGLFQG